MNRYDTLNCIAHGISEYVDETNKHRDFPLNVCCFHIVELRRSDGYYVLGVLDTNTEEWLEEPDIESGVMPSFHSIYEWYAGDWTELLSNKPVKSENVARVLTDTIMYAASK